MSNLIRPSEKQRREIISLIQDRVKVGAWLPEVIDEIVDIFNREETYCILMNLKVIDFMVVANSDHLLLSKEINHLLKEGWFIHGYMLKGGFDGSIYTQCLVKYE